MTTEHIHHVLEVLNKISFPGYVFHAQRSDDRVYIYASWKQADNFRPGSTVNEIQFSRRWLIRPEASTSEIVQTALKCVLTAMEHEVREQFLYRGRAIFGPHHDVDALWEIAGHMEPVENAT